MLPTASVTHTHTQRQKKRKIGHHEEGEAENKSNPRSMASKNLHRFFPTNPQPHHWAAISEQPKNQRDLPFFLRDTTHERLTQSSCLHAPKRMLNANMQRYKKTLQKIRPFL